MINEIVEYSPDGDDLKLRILFCRESAATNPPERNPLIETSFNDLLQKLAQKAFDEGRAYERKRPKYAYPD
jgi:hypothetical protein